MGSVQREIEDGTCHNLPHAFFYKFPFSKTGDIFLFVPCFYCDRKKENKGRKEHLFESFLLLQRRYDDEFPVSFKKSC